MRRLILTLSVALLLSLLPFGLAAAHVERQVGKYKLEVGWTSEPPLTGEKNSIVVVVENTETERPVEGLETTLTVTISFGGRTFRPDLIPQTEERGHYIAGIVPTRPGIYTVIVSGSIEGLGINESFEIEKVVDRSALQFPEKEPSSSDALKAANDAKASSENAFALGLAGTALGAIGIAFGVASYIRAKKYQRKGSE